MIVQLHCQTDFLAVVGDMDASQQRNKKNNFFQRIASTAEGMHRSF